MIDISLILVFGASQVDSFYKLFSLSYTPFYTTGETPQALPGKEFELQTTPKRAIVQHFKREFFNRAALLLAEFVDRFIAFLQDLGFCKPKRSLNFTVALLLQRQKSHSFTLRSCRSAWQEKQKYAASTEKVRTLQNCETLIGKGLRAFLLVRTVISWRVLAYRFNLQESAPTEREARRSTGCEGRSFWRWIEAHHDIPIVVQSAAFLQKREGAL